VAECLECGEAAKGDGELCLKCGSKLPVQSARDVIMAAEQIHQHRGDKVKSKIVNDPDAIIDAYEKGKSAAGKRILSEEDECVVQSEGDKVQQLLDSAPEEIDETHEERKERFNQFIADIPHRVITIQKQMETIVDSKIASQDRKNISQWRKSRLRRLFLGVGSILLVLIYLSALDNGEITENTMYSPIGIAGLGFILLLLLYILHVSKSAPPKLFPKSNNMLIYDIPRNKTKPIFDGKWYRINMRIPAFVPPIPKGIEGLQQMTNYYLMGGFRYALFFDHSTQYGEIIDYEIDEDILLIELDDGREYRLLGDYFVKRLFVLLSAQKVVEDYFGKNIYFFDDELNFYG